MEPITVLLTFFGVFASETIKNMAKGSANILQQQIHSLLNPEFIALNLDGDDSVDTIQKKLGAHPEIQETIRHKLEKEPDLLRQLTELLEKRTGRTINTKTYIETASGGITINQ